MTPSTELKPPAAQVFDLLREQAPADPSAFWGYAATVVAHCIPPDVAARPRYFSDVRVVLLSTYCTNYDLPDDEAVNRQVDVALAIVERHFAQSLH